MEVNDKNKNRTMKQIILVLSFVMIALTTSAQTKQYPKPDWEDQVMLYDTVANSLSDLESKKFEVKMGLTGNIYLKLQGGSSTLRLKSNQVFFFIIKPKFKEMNPAAHLGFTVLKVEKKIRSFRYFQNNLFTPGKVNNFETTGWKLKKVTDDLVMISFDKPLPPGEYCFYTLRAGWPYDYYAFGVE